MRTLRLYAVRECERFNYKRGWKYRLQVLGSILVWAHRANATRVIHDPALDQAFVYLAADGTTVESEFPQPTGDIRDDLRRTLFLDTYDGHPIFRPIRRLLRSQSMADLQLELKVPDFENEVISVWRMTIGRHATTIVLTGTEACSQPHAYRAHGIDGLRWFARIWFSLAYGSLLALTIVVIYLILFTPIEGAVSIVGVATAALAGGTVTLTRMFRGFRANMRELELRSNENIG